MNPFNPKTAALTAISAYLHSAAWGALATSGHWYWATWAQNIAIWQACMAFLFAAGVLMRVSDSRLMGVDAQPSTKKTKPAGQCEHGHSHGQFCEECDAVIGSREHPL